MLRELLGELPEEGGENVSGGCTEGTAPRVPVGCSAHEEKGTANKGSHGESHGGL